MRQIDKIIIHWSGTEQGNVYGFRRYHINERHWSDIGYHYVISDQDVVEVGRPVWKIGAHCPGQNQNSIGVCYVGSPKSPVIDDEESGLIHFNRIRRWNLLSALVGSLLATHELTPEDVYGHRDFKNTLCPGFDIQILRTKLHNLTKGVFIEK